MTIALRGFIVGFCLAVALEWWKSPPIGVLIGAVFFGFTMGIATAWTSDVVEWLFGDTREQIHKDDKT